MPKITGFKDTIAWYDANAQTYADALENVPSLELLNAFVASLPQGTRVLDAGCAAGRDSSIMKKLGFSPVGVDLSEGLLAQARKRHPDIDFVQGDFLHLPFEDDHFLGVWAHASLLHFETIEEVSKALEEFLRVLKPGGLLQLFVKEPPGTEKFSVVSDSLSGHDRFFQWFTVDEVRDLLEKAGYTIETIFGAYQDPAGRQDVSWVCARAIKP